MHISISIFFLALVRYLNTDGRNGLFDESKLCRTKRNQTPTDFVDANIIMWVVEYLSIFYLI
ncbi:hypothetical protein RHGRI_023397 [Rhododendron griersonianum]|uniref:Uncharacterized protein n=1 Tax=Rhododendron griersonianum TaxID=479676 RepID=A0AAV6J7F2_9ERIC|nr:hypothetical protein RHGRI_023397 [Rhododendron griersonianum]